MQYDLIDTPLGKLLVAGDKEGIRCINFQQGSQPFPIGTNWERNRRVMRNAVIQLNAYFSGHLKRFDLKLAPEGTDFQQNVWRALQDIPYGVLVSYQDIANKIGNPKACRAVGAANGKNPIPIVIPCHRVIGSNGQLTGFAGGLHLKEYLIELESATYASPKVG
jgi:methylated-DNA-[protein]-cysteine S-methyltransferase